MGQIRLAYTQYPSLLIPICISCEKGTFNPLSPDSDQDQFSPNNIHMLPREMVMRVNKMIA